MISAETKSTCAGASVRTSLPVPTKATEGIWARAVYLGNTFMVIGAILAAVSLSGNPRFTAAGTAWDVMVVMLLAGGAGSTTFGLWYRKREQRPG